MKRWCVYAQSVLLMGSLGFGYGTLVAITPADALAQIQTSNITIKEVIDAVSSTLQEAHFSSTDPAQNKAAITFIVQKAIKALPENLWGVDLGPLKTQSIIPQQMVGGYVRYFPFWRDVVKKISIFAEYPSAALNTLEALYNGAQNKISPAVRQILASMSRDKSPIDILKENKASFSNGCVLVSPYLKKISQFLEALYARALQGGAVRFGDVESSFYSIFNPAELTSFGATAYSNISQLAIKPDIARGVQDLRAVIESLNPTQIAQVIDSAVKIIEDVMNKPQPLPVGPSAAPVSTMPQPQPIPSTPAPAAPKPASAKPVPSKK